MRLTSDAFDDGEPIPERYGYRAENVNPPLTIHDVPDEAETLTLVVDDPDAVEPAGKVWDHWVVWNLPAETTTIPAGFDPESAGAVEGTNDYGEVGYGGPNPPDRRHTYRFVARALDTALALDSGETKAELERAAEGHVVAEAHLSGTYAP
jgi:hypothetical protein